MAASSVGTNVNRVEMPRVTCPAQTPSSADVAFFVVDERGKRRESRKRPTMDTVVSIAKARCSNWTRDEFYVENTSSTPFDMIVPDTGLTSKQFLHGWDSSSGCRISSGIKPLPMNGNSL